MNLKETVVKAIHEAANAGFDKQSNVDGQLSISLDDMSIVGFSTNSDGTLETVLANVSSIADLIIGVVSNEIAELILNEGPWCSSKDHTINTETGESLGSGTCPCYAFSASLARKVAEVE